MSKFDLSNSQRKILVYRVIPTLLLGFAIWMVTGLFFSGYITGSFILFDWWVYMLLFIADVVIMIGMYFITRKGQNLLGIGLFSLFSFIDGLLTTPTLIWGSLVLNLELAQEVLFISVCLGAGAVVLCLIIGISMGGRFLSTGYFWHHLIAFGFGIVFLEMILIWTFGVTSWVLILVSVIVLVYITLITVLDGALLASDLDEDNYVYWAFQIFLDLIIFIVRIFITLVSVLAGED